MVEYMNYFVVILLLGIVLAGLLILLVVTVGTQKRKQIQELNIAGEKLEKILAESETMIEELNRFSDYVVNLMEEKDNQLKSTSRYAEDLLNKLKDNASGPVLVQEKVSERINNQNKIESIKNETAQNAVFKRDKVVPLNPKHREILELAEYGMSDTDIAKSLQMGKGEVQLILGIKRG